MMDDLTKLKRHVEPYVLDGHVEDLGRYAAARNDCYACGLVQFVEQFRYTYESLAHDQPLAQRVAADHRCLYDMRLQKARLTIAVEQSLLDCDRLTRERDQLRRDKAAGDAARGWMPRQRTGPLHNELRSGDPRYVALVAQVFPLVALRFHREGFGWPTLDQATATFVTLTGYDESVAARVLASELDRDETPLSVETDDHATFRLSLAESAHANLEAKLDEWRAIDGGHLLPSNLIASEIPR